MKEDEEYGCWRKDLEKGTDTHTHTYTRNRLKDTVHTQGERLLLRTKLQIQNVWNEAPPATGRERSQNSQWSSKDKRKQEREKENEGRKRERERHTAWTLICS